MQYSVIRVIKTDEYNNTYNDEIYKGCADNLLHLRLRDYKIGDVISGVVDKISFLITYLYQSMMYVWKDIGHNEVDDEVLLEKCYQGHLENLLDTNDMSEIVYRVKQYLGCSGIKVFKKYTRPMYKKTIEAFGSIENYKYTVNNDTLMKLLDNLGLTLKELLLNDGIELVITESEDRASNRYAKFRNKFLKELADEPEDVVEEETVDSGINPISLWSNNISEVEDGTRLESIAN